MYCPSCLHDSLSMSDKGIIHLSVNGKKRDTSKLTYNTSSEPEEKLLARLKEKIEELLDWYTGFQNKTPEHLLKIVSGNFHCLHSCVLPPNLQSSIINRLIPLEKLAPILRQYEEKYKIKIELYMD